MTIFLYDTSNFVDFPIGGQLSSIRNFLRYAVECRPDLARSIKLIGVTTDPDEIGVESKVTVDAAEFDFLPVTFAETDLANVKGSLRLRYTKALLNYVPRMSMKKDTVNFIHTPEAFGPIKVLGRGRCCVFSHGSFFNMKDGFRFYSGTPLAVAFDWYLHWLLRRADLLFALDSATCERYRVFNEAVYQVNNSVSYRENVKRHLDLSGIKLLFVGRLSAIKNIGPIMQAAESMPEVASLHIVGDGEERAALEANAGPKTNFLGVLSAEGVREQMREADVLVMNSLHEGVPMTILEAMGMGLPVVSTDVGGIAEVAPFGIVAERTDGTPESIAVAVRAVVGDYAIRSSAAYRMSEAYDYRIVNAKIADALLSQGGK